MGQQRFEIGMRVVYSHCESGSRPPQGAHHIRPTRNGDSIQWLRDNPGEVLETRPDGLLLVRMDDGEQRLLAASDPSLRRATLAERLLRRRSFPRAG